MRQRISDNLFDDSKVEDKNEIYKKFAFQFSNLFNTGETAKNNEDFEKMYISDIEFEEAINNFLCSINSTAQFCIGYTGIGKTTSIRHCFNLGVSTAPVLTTLSKITKDKYMVIFPTFLDGYTQSIGNQFDLPGRVSAVCTVLEKAHPELQEICNTFDGRRELYDFILKHTPHILEAGGSLWELDKSSEEDRIIKRLDNGMKYYPLEFCACKLKFYILKKYDRYDRLVIILDDVESMPEDFQEHIIADYFRLFSCMQNTIYPEDSNYRVNLIISLRPHTYRIFSNGMRGRMLAAYPLEVPIIKSHAVDLTSLFQNRFDYYTSMSPKVIGNLESWKVCYEELMLINQAFDSKYKDMISNLCFMNVRASLAEYAKIFTNRFWVQHNHADSGAFSVFPDELTINNVTVIRALGCGNSKMFTGEYNPIIPNFFCTTHDMDYSIQCLLVMQYFREKMQVFSGGGVEYGLNAEELHEVYAEWRYVLDEKRVKQLRCALYYLFECKILRKSIMDFDDYQALDTSKSLDETSRLYMSPRGIELMNMLKRDSILLEMLRECVWREYSGREDEYCLECSHDLVRNKRQNNLYMDLLEYVESLRQMEVEFFSNQEGISLCEYRKLFGSSLVVEGLLSGIENSLRFSGKIYNSMIAKKFYQVKGKIVESKIILMEG